MESPVDAEPASPVPKPGGALPLPQCDELLVTVIERRPGLKAIDLRELWRYRELFLALSWRDISVRYRQTSLGVAWAVLQPLLMTIVFSLFIFRLAGVDTGSVSYPLYTFAGMVPWMFFATAIAHEAVGWKSGRA